MRHMNLVGFCKPSVLCPIGGQSHGLVDERLGGQTKAGFFPVERVVDFLPQNLLHQELWVGSVDGRC